jgi:hypothetical protein
MTVQLRQMLVVLQGPWQAAIEAAVSAIEATDTDCRVLDIGANAGACCLGYCCT